MSEAGPETRGPKLEAVQSRSMSRRDVLALAAGFAALFPAAAVSQGTLDAAGFMAASSLVTGVAEGQLTELRSALLAAFQAQGPAIMQLAAIARQTPSADLAATLKGSALEPVAKALAAAWYTGTAGAGPSAKLLSYDDALVWTVAGFASAPGNCGGEFGFWAEPPPPL